MGEEEHEIIRDMEIDLEPVWDSSVPCFSTPLYVF